MKTRTQVSQPPLKPVLLFDGDCGFCRRWVDRWREQTGDAVLYSPFQDEAFVAAFPELDRNRFRESVHLIEASGDVFTGSEAVFRALAHGPPPHFSLWCYEHLPGFAPVSETVYRFVARHRQFFSALTRLILPHPDSDSRRMASIFIRGLGLIYFFAFLSLWSQIIGLAGHDGIFPVERLLGLARAQLTGWERVHQLPTFCWISAGDGALHFQCALGTTLSLLVLAGIGPALSLAALWLLYLSLTAACGIFLGFQWDNLLLDTGLITIFLAPLGWRLRWPRSPSRLPIWLLRILLFRLMFFSGCVKLASHDPAWAKLEALRYHYETQPLPTWVGWYLHQSPAGFHKTSVVLMFVLELLVPWLIFGPRRLRLFAAPLLMLLQTFISLTGNYAFFNLLTILLCFALLDDRALRAIARAGWLGKLARRFLAWRALPERVPTAPAKARGRLWPALISWPVMIFILLIATVQFVAFFQRTLPWPRLVRGLYSWQEPFRSINQYGLFAVMTTNRFEIIVSGSDDGRTWKPYEFKYKPGDPARAPQFVEPHQPRLDWQMWFAALGTYQENPWFVFFCQRLLAGSPEVLRLLKSNPFPAKPPRFIRAELYLYHFTDFTERRRTGNWWRREKVREYLPPLSVR